MAKSPDKDGKQREELKARLPEPGETVISREKLGRNREALTKINEAPADSAHKTIEAAVDQGETIAFPLGSTLSKPEAELLARSFRNKKKEDTVPLDQAIDFAKSRNAKLQEMKGKRRQQVQRVIQQLRMTDPKGKKTCGRCGYRVLILDMDSKKELCEICSA